MTDDTGLVEVGRTARRVKETGDPRHSDPRLRRVWNLLMATNRKDGQFRHPTRYPMLVPEHDTAEERQLWAIRMLLSAVQQRPQPLKRHERDALCDDLGTLAATLRTMVDRLRPFNLRWDSPECLDPLTVAAYEADAIADDLNRPGVLVFDRDRGMQVERATALWLAWLCQVLFGKPMYGVVARLVEVSTGRRVGRLRIRDWCKARE